ncbi:sodium- and chloride-dependent neutral and basic amino acid transporter B(0+)-like isoform X2 [Rhinatrema bivittatum]|uniref:sodium- and chloride-dependent neutral and basic amino acid transporter B(0+)-like isoform X2 n=1 Tax=Rhinatrema bivittatum TaxID=194408 RepID=UPI001129A815|nr:sodium- and chloride-dependent neutral and basic amino acid transporter B(0+)-like isoform X2 [Rhinatrema bivittatum]
MDTFIPHPESLDFISDFPSLDIRMREGALSTISTFDVAVEGQVTPNALLANDASSSTAVALLRYVEMLPEEENQSSTSTLIPAPVLTFPSGPGQSPSGAMDTFIPRSESPDSTSDLRAREGASLTTPEFESKPECDVTLPLDAPLERVASSSADAAFPTYAQELEEARKSSDSSVKAEEFKEMEVAVEDSYQTLFAASVGVSLVSSKIDIQLPEPLVALPLKEREICRLTPIPPVLLAPFLGRSETKLKRATWPNKREACFALVGYAVGLGNVWRFPYLTYKHGGGAFLIPYTIMLVFTGFPLFFLECAFGQFASLGPIAIWKIAPILEGVGFTMVITSAIVSIYYNVIIAYSFFYLFASFQRVLPWSDCYEWANENCSKTIIGFCNTSSEMNIITVNMTWVDQNNLTCINSIVWKKTELPSQQYWRLVALRQSSGIDETGKIVWHLALCLLLAWTLVAVALFKGIKSSGKVVYFTVVFPYIVLSIFVIRGLTLDGAQDGIDFFIGTQSDISKLKNAEAWKDAATQVFYSLSTAWGGIVALTSYNKFNNNCYLDAAIMCCINAFTSLLAGFAIFTVLGNMAFILKKPISDVVEGGFGLAFMAYPEALNQLPYPPFWSILFFFMLVTLGMDSQFTLIETITTAIQDAYPKIMRKLRIPITIGCCIVLYLLGLLCVTQAGIYWVNLMDYFCGGWVILISAILEIIGICWMYGGNRFIEDIEMMLGKKSFMFWLYWRACWFYITPVFLIIILIWSVATMSPVTFDEQEYPTWATVLGWLMLAFCLIWIPILALEKIYKARGNLWQRIVKSCSSAPNWGPALTQNWGERYKHLSVFKDSDEAIDKVKPALQGIFRASYEPSDEEDNEEEEDDDEESSQDVTLRPTI